MSQDKSREEFEAARHELPIALLKDVFEVDSWGNVYWLRRPVEHFPSPRAAASWNARYSGKRAGMTKLRDSSKTGYVSIQMKVDGKQIHLLAHRIVWAIHFGRWPSGLLDHVDGNGMNNALSNLREVSTLESGMNRPLQGNNKTGVSGVTFDARGRLRVQANLNGRSIHLGYYKTIFDAACAKKSFEAANGFHKNHGRKAIEAAGLKVAP